jgi:hypothetical protein
MTQLARQYGRRSTQVKGFVNFPVHLPNGNEGGMFVRLVVVPPEYEPPPIENSEEFDEDSEAEIEYRKNKPVVCCGGLISYHYDEVLFATDESDCIPWWEKTTEQIVASSKRDDIELRHFPYLGDESKSWENSEKFLSTQYLAVILMGSTGWNGRFRCTYDDLTDDGKALYDSVKKLHPTSTLVLQTWLDT